MQDAIVVGSGPNGLAAAVALGQAGLRVLVRERDAELGGGTRTQPLTLPGFLHDHCSAIHPLAAGSPFLRRLPLEQHGLEWIQPPACLAHPFDDGTAALLSRSTRDTGETLGEDARAWRALFDPLATHFDDLIDETFGALLHLPRRPLLLARFGVSAILPAAVLARGRFRGERARALFAGIAGHAQLPLDRSPSASFALVLGAAGHAVGWPFPRGGASHIALALASLVHAQGGAIETRSEVTSLQDLPAVRATLLDVTPRQLLRMAGDRLPRLYARRLGAFRYGPGAFKLDWALSAPIPWRASAVARAGTVHLGGTLDEMIASEETVSRGGVPERPFVILAQHTLFDRARAPDGRHTAWAYCHVPNGSTADMTGAIERQIERFAPGFREVVLARSVLDPAALERSDPNIVGGDIGAGANTLVQMAFRPAPRFVPWSTPIEGVYLCSASTPPGGGVHGMCGWHAAQAALRDLQR
jgi:phytoene dehydrogenase-like protein